MHHMLGLSLTGAIYYKGSGERKKKSNVSPVNEAEL